MLDNAKTPKERIVVKIKQVPLIVEKLPKETMNSQTQYDLITDCVVSTQTDTLDEVDHQGLDNEMRWSTPSTQRLEKIYEKPSHDVKVQQFLATYSSTKPVVSVTASSMQDSTENLFKNTDNIQSTQIDDIYNWIESSFPLFLDGDGSVTCSTFFHTLLTYARHLRNDPNNLKMVRSIKERLHQHLLAKKTSDHFKSDIHILVCLSYLECLENGEPLGLEIIRHMEYCMHDKEHSIILRNVEGCDTILRVMLNNGDDLIDCLGDLSDGKILSIS